MSKRSSVRLFAVLQLGLLGQGAGWIGGAGPAWAQPIQAVGQVLDLRPARTQDIRILRKDGHRDEAHAFDLLYAGDAVEITAEGVSAQVFDMGSRRSKRITRDDGRYVAGGTAPGTIDVKATEFMQGFNALFAAPRKPIPLETEVRGAVSAPPLSADSLLPTGPQMMPRGSTAIAVTWHGGAAAVRIAQGNGAQVAAAQPGSLTSAVLKVPPLAGEYALVIGDKALVWPISTVEPSAVPETPWAAAGQAAANDAERVVRAAWLIRQGPPDWRLFAVSEIAALSERNYAAERLWQAIRAGDFPGRQ